MASTGFKTSTFLYEKYADAMDAVASSSVKLSNIMTEIRRISTKNSETLQTYYVGRSLLINEADQTAIFDILGLKKDDVIAVCKQSPRLDGIGKIADQFAFALPLLILVGRLHKKGKDDYAKSIFLFAHYRPYASNVAKFFTYLTVDEKAMDYTVNMVLTNKSYIHLYGTVYGVLVASAQTTYDAYIGTLSGNPVPTDDMLFNNIFYSSIYSKMSSFVKSLYGVYKQTKADGKYLTYKKGFFNGTDDDGDTVAVTQSSESNSSIRKSYVSAANTAFLQNPIDSRCLDTAVTASVGKKSVSIETYLQQAVMNVANQKMEQMPRYFDAVVGSFLNGTDDTGIANSPADIKNIKFLAYVKRAFRTQHTLDKDVNDFKHMTEELLQECSIKYTSFGTTQKIQMRQAFILYFALFIQNANK